MLPLCLQAKETHGRENTIAVKATAIVLTLTWTSTTAPLEVDVNTCRVTSGATGRPDGALEMSLPHDVKCIYESFASNDV